MLEFAIREAVFKIASDCRNTGFNFDKLSSKKLHNLIHGGHRQKAVTRPRGIFGSDFEKELNFREKFTI